ncbi:ADP-ribosylation factor-like protein 6-interacting protein 4 isoform X2 [Belonocnema kinseyi]|nr:ADP-ribosylation factor-like protein 6-interacting protein 4 isoform X2 [Belonocnema kinseyi]
MRGGRDMNNRNYNNFNRPQQGRMNQGMNYEYRRRGAYQQRNNEPFVRDRYTQRQRFDKERPAQDYNNSSYKAEESRQYETSSRADHHHSHAIESRDKPKAVTSLEESSSSRPSEETLQKKKRSRSSSSSSSSSTESSSDSEESSSSESSSSSEDEKKRKKRKKMAKKLKKAEKKRKKKKLKKKLKKMKTKKEKPVKDKKKVGKLLEDGTTAVVEQPVVAEKAKAMAPMTKEQWEKKQSVVRKVYDKETGRQRLIKGDGEVIEEIVSRDRHKEINRQATRGDGEFFQSQLRVNQ